MMMQFTSSFILVATTALPPSCYVIPFNNCIVLVFELEVGCYLTPFKC